MNECNRKRVSFMYYSIFWGICEYITEGLKILIMFKLKYFTLIIFNFMFIRLIFSYKLLCKFEIRPGDFVKILK